MKKKLFWVCHSIYLLFFICIVIAGFTTKTYDIPAEEGAPQELRALSLPAVNLVLDQFSIQKNSSKTEVYVSDLSFITPDQTNRFQLAVNHPISFKGIFFYQKSYSIAYKTFKIRFEGKEFDMMAGNSVLTTQGNYFSFYPETVSGREISYRFTVENKNGLTVSTGLFSRESVMPEDLKEMGFEIISIDYHFISVIQAVSAPFMLPLTVSAVLFLAALGIGLLHGSKKGDENGTSA